MNTRRLQLTCLSLLAAVALMPEPVSAKASAQEAAQLGHSLTPVGAIAAGNADGSIGPWLGTKNFDAALRQETPQSIDALHQAVDELRAKSPQDFEALIKAADDLKKDLGNHAAFAQALETILSKLPADSQRRARAFFQQMGGAGTSPLFVITRANLASHADQLSEGQKALFNRYADYQMIVYPTLRTGFYPPQIEQATIRNASSAELKGSDEITGATLGFPFPLPKSGAEAIWNHKTRFRGSAVRRYNNQAIVKPDGSYKISKLIEDVKFKYSNLKESNPGTRILFYYLSEVLSPPRVAGQLLLIHEPSGAGGAARDAWLFNPGLGRVNRAPDVGYDNPAVGTDGEQFNDQIDVFNGALDRYDWKLIGRKEMYIPYNSLWMLFPALRYQDIIRPGHINQSFARYELHRVWAVEANLRQRQRHQFKRRVFYIDEDGWAIAGVDCYDNRDQLWKVQEAHLLSVPFVGTVVSLPEIIYDLQSSRYFLTTLVNEDKIVDFKINFKDDDFSPAAMSQKARH